MTNFDSFEFADNPDPRSAVVLVLDCSSSMAEALPGETQTPLDALNSGLETLVRELHSDPLARRRVELSVVTFGSQASEATPFSTVEELVLPTLTASGLTAMGSAVNTALDALEARKQQYKDNGIQYFRPMVIVITDGLPTDDTSAAVARVREMEARKALSFFAVGVEGADLERLSQFSETRVPLMLQGLKFNEFFQWLSASQAAVSASQPGDRVAMPSPAGWAEL